MAVYREVRCDYCNLPDVTGQVSRGFASLEFMRNQLVIVGWKYRRGEDICPQCFKEGAHKKR